MPPAAIGTTSEVVKGESALNPAYLSSEPTSKTQEAGEKPMKRNDSVSRFLNFLNTHSSMSVNLTTEVSYTQRRVIQDNVMDRNFTFSVPYFEDGSEKMFFSLPFIIADATYRNTDIDTKDVNVKSDNLAAMDWIPLIRGAVRNYLKVHRFEAIMNDIRRELIDMGHVITKEVDGDTEIVQLINIVRPADVMDLQDGGLVESTYLSYEDMLTNKSYWEKSWNDIEQLKSVMDSVQRNVFRVYEWWTMDWFEVAGEKKYTRGCIKFLDKSLIESNLSERPEDWVPACELERFASPYFEKINNKKLIKKMEKQGLIENGNQRRIYPYEEERLIRVPGRWMGMGYYEMLRHEGKAFNRTLNEKLQYDEILHKGIMVHTKSPFTSNVKGSGRGLEADVMNRIQSGAVISIKAGEKLDRLNMGSLTADFIETAEYWFKLARQKVGVSETAIGDRLPSSTTATVGVLNEKQSKNAFDIVNEQQGIFFQNLFTRFKIDEIIDDITETEWAKIIGDREELMRMEEKFIENLVNTSINKSAQEGMFVPMSSVFPPEERKRIMDAVKLVRAEQGEARFAQFKRELLKDFDLNVSFYITNDGYDKQVVLNSVQNAIDTVAKNPMTTLDMDKLIEMKMEIMDLNIAGLRKSPEQIEQDRMMAMMAATGGQSPAAAPTVTENIGKSFGQSNKQTAVA